MNCSEDFQLTCLLESLSYLRTASGHQAKTLTL
jgi:hypothetical protein